MFVTLPNGGPSSGSCCGAPPVPVNRWQFIIITLPEIWLPVSLPAALHPSSGGVKRDGGGGPRELWRNYLLSTRCISSRLHILWQMSRSRKINISSGKCGIRISSKAAADGSEEGSNMLVISAIWLIDSETTAEQNSIHWPQASAATDPSFSASLPPPREHVHSINFWRELSPFNAINFILNLCIRLHSYVNSALSSGPAHQVLPPSFEL